MNYDFDDLARAIANGISRRDALKRMGTGLAGLLLSSMGIRRATAAVTCSTCQACDIDSTTCGLPCNPTTSGQTICTAASLDGSYIRLTNYLITAGFESTGSAEPVIFYQGGKIQESVLAQNFQNPSSVGETAYLAYALSSAGDASAFAAILQNAIPTILISIDPSGRVVLELATQTTDSTTNAAQKLATATKQIPPTSLTKAKTKAEAITKNLAPSQCNSVVNNLCQWVDTIYWVPLCKELSLDVCAVTGPEFRRCWKQLENTCTKLNNLAVSDCEQQLKAQYCTCPSQGQQLCGDVCCDFCEDCDPVSGACIDRTCGKDPFGRTLQCCSGTTQSTCCEGGYNCVNGVCTSPNPGCIGATCETFVACSTNPDCVCGSVAEGGGLCVPGSTLCAPLTKCVSTGDCAGGSLCLIETCCGTGVCVPTSLTCPPQATTNARSNAAQKAATGPTIGHR